MRKNNGFSVVEVFVVIVVVGIIVALGLVGYNSWKQSEKTTGNSSSTSQQTTSSAAPEIKASSDLDKALTVLDQTDVTGTDDSQLESQSSSF